MMNSMNHQINRKSTAEKALFKIRQHMAQNLPLIEDMDIDMQYQQPTILPTINRTSVKWSTLTLSDLPEGNDPGIPLIEIIQKRHATTHDEDNRQVNPF